MNTTLSHRLARVASISRWVPLPRVAKLHHPRVLARTLGPALALAFVVACKSQSAPEPTAKPQALSTAEGKGGAGMVSPAVTPPAVTPPAVTPAATPARHQGAALAISWTDPPTWKRVTPSNAMRQASFEIPAAEGDNEGAELNVFYFGPRRPGGGDAIEANVNRWVGQFKGLPPEAVVRDTTEANGLKQHTVEIKTGTFASGGMMMGAPPVDKPEFGLLGGIVESPHGDYFFKMTGPAKTVAAARTAFLEFMKSVKPAG